MKGGGFFRGGGFELQKGGGEDLFREGCELQKGWGRCHFRGFELQKGGGGFISGRWFRITVGREEGGFISGMRFRIIGLELVKEEGA